MAAAMELNQAVEWFLCHQSMSPKKLQKMLYYAYSWGLVFLNDDPDKLENKLFEATFESWVHGPVVREVYNQYQPYGFQDIPKKDTPTSFDLPTEAEDVLQQVLYAYGDLSGNQLEAITHTEEPWIEARGKLRPMDSSNATLKDSTIYNYYLSELGD